MTEIMQHLVKKLHEELEGVTSYAEMAKMAEAAGEKCKAAMLRDMAREEFCHAKHIKEMIHDHKEGPAPANHAEMVKKYQDAEMVIKDL